MGRKLHQKNGNGPCYDGAMSSRSILFGLRWLLWIWHQPNGTWRKPPVSWKVLTFWRGPKNDLKIFKFFGDPTSFKNSRKTRRAHSESEHVNECCRGMDFTAWKWINLCSKWEIGYYFLEALPKKRKNCSGNKHLVTIIQESWYVDSLQKINHY